MGLRARRGISPLDGLGGPSYGLLVRAFVRERPCFTTQKSFTALPFSVAVVRHARIVVAAVLNRGTATISTTRGAVHCEDHSS
jgi:hypothetical protein